ncbi:MAG: glycosyltransferase family 39 protein [Anaerolineae bacterium]|nr:glycosyltransferase family 39 protein [Anaerolineae bacterium]
MNRKPHAVTRRDLFALVLILVMAAAVRVDDLGRLTVYRYDQAELSFMAIEMASGEGIPTLGINSSAGVPNSPVTVYTLAPFFAITHDPQFVTVCIGLMNVAGVGLLWLLAHRYLNPRAAALAGMIYALNPYAAQYSRSIWAQDTHTPIILLGLLLALAGFMEGRRWAQVLALPVLLWGVQIHYAAWTLVPVYGWIVVVGWRRIEWRALVITAALGAAVMVPFVIGSRDSPGDFNDRLDSIHAVLKYDLRVRQDALDHAVSLATGRHLEKNMGNPVSDRVAASVKPFTYAWALVGMLALVGVIGAWRRVGWQTSALLLLWTVVPVLVFITNWTATGIYTHYFIPVIPGLALLSAFGLDWLLSLLPRRRVMLRGVIVAALGAIVLTWAGWFQMAIRDTSARYDPDTLGPPLFYLKDVRAELLAYDDVLLVGADTGRSGHPIWRSLLVDSAACVREMVITEGGIAVLPDGPFALLEPPDALDYPAAALYTGGTVAEVPLRPGEGSYTITGFDAAPAWTNPDWHGPALIERDPVRYANGAQLAGYRLTADTLYLAWDLPGANPDLGYQRVFAHLLDADGERIGQRDFDFWPGVYWCAGDRLVTWIDLAVPNGVHTLRVGMYTLEDGLLTYTDVVDVNGGPVAPWVDIPVE